MNDALETDTRLAVYGTLAPGRSNHHQLAGLQGRWFDGCVRGRLAAAEWGAWVGYTGLMVDGGEESDVVAVQVFESDDLPEHWSRLDLFEGPAFRRTPVEVDTVDGVVIAFVYALATE